MPAIELAWIIGGFVLGAIIGSFVATLVIRWPRGESVMRGRSHCDACGKILNPVELLPLISTLISGGKCRSCMHPIDRRHGWIELMAALIGAGACAASPGWAGLAGAVFGWLLLALAVLDRAHFWLPDRLTLPLAITGLGASWVDDGPALTDRLIALIAGFGALALIGLVYRHVRGREGLGLGDAKMLGGISAWLGWFALPWVLILAGLIGGVLVAAEWIKGHAITRHDALPLGMLMAIAAWMLWFARTALMLF